MDLEGVLAVLEVVHLLDGLRRQLARGRLPDGLAFT